MKPVEGSLRKEIKGHAVREENREDAHLPPESIFTKNEKRRKQLWRCILQLRPIVIILIIGMLLGGSLCDFKAFSTNISATTTEQGLVMAAGVGASFQYGRIKWQLKRLRATVIQAKE